jgi:hypothetical protein
VGRPSILGFFLLQHIPVTYPRGIALMSKCFHTSDRSATSTSKDRACSLRPGARTGSHVDGNNVGDHNSTTKPEALVRAAPENTVASQVGSSVARWACSSTGDSKKIVFGTHSLARRSSIGQSTLNGWTSRSRQVTTRLLRLNAKSELPNTPQGR